MSEPKKTYTVITFAPVQGFIEKSRKLRDLYGSSYLLSLLSWVICQAGQKQGCEVVSPASANITQGMPNQIILKGEISDEEIREIKESFYRAWRAIANTCREWIENNVQFEGQNYAWKRDWDLWGSHAWEFFSAQGEPGESITQVRELINQEKVSRDWTGINWQGESSTLSGSDAIAYHHLGITGDPRKYSYREEQEAIASFYTKLSLKLGEAFIGILPKKEREEIDNLTLQEKNELAENYGSSFINVREQLSIPEVIKRLITHRVVIEQFEENFKSSGLYREGANINQIAEDLKPRSFRNLNRHKDDIEEEKYWTGWFQGDGDGAGKYFKSLKPEEEEKGTHDFSEEMRAWGKEMKEKQYKYLGNKGRTIYAGGDDFLGVLYYEEKQIQPKECLDFLSSFKSKVWHGDKPKKITSSVGFVWAGAQVPQRDILQHCRDAEKSAKNSGRDRLALRILFNSGNHLEWVCPWWVLDEAEISKLKDKFPTPEKTLINSYKSPRGDDSNWTHFYRDVALLESRHSFDGERITVEKELVNNPEINIALGLMEIYFGSEWFEIIKNPKNWFNCYDENELQLFTGILGDPKSFDKSLAGELTEENLKKLRDNYKVKKALNDWVINLAKVGFRLTEDKK